MTNMDQDEPEMDVNEETFIWQAALAIAQGSSTRGDVLQAPKTFANDCIEKAVALWDAYVLAIEGGPF